MRAPAWIADLRADFRYAVRTLYRNPGFAVASILTLTLGIGANTAVFSVVNTVLVKPLPYPDPEAIVVLMTTLRGRGSAPSVSAPKFDVWSRNTDAFLDTAVYRMGGVMNLTDRDQPEQVATGHVSASFFRLFGATLAQGRTFTAEEDRPNGARVAIVGNAFWRRHFGPSSSVAGQTLSLDGEPYSVIGVLAPDFDADSLSPVTAPRADLWLPLQLEPGSQSDAPLFVAARLREGITLEVAQAQTDAAVVAIRQEFPAVMPVDAGLSVERLHRVMVGDVRPSLLMLMAAVGVVLLLVCANLANLFLARALDRQREIAVRMAAGASRGRIARQLLTESLVLSLSAGTLGCLLALIGTQALPAMHSLSIPRVGADNPAYVLDSAVLAFTLMVAIATGVLFGLAPAVRASRLDLDAVLRLGADRAGAGFGHSRLRALLVVSEIALAVTLLIGSSLLIRSLVTLRGVNPGFEGRGLLTMQTAVTGRRFATMAGVSQTVRDGLQRVGSLPGVDRAAATLTGAPLSGFLSFLNITIPGRSLDGPYYAGGYLGGWHLISPDYFNVLEIPLVSGRPFTARDDRGAPPVVIINQAMLRQFWPNESPIGHSILIGQGAGPDYEETTPRRIVGVVGDVRHVGLEFNPRLTAYVPLTQMSDDQAAFFNRIGGRLTWMVRTREETHRFTELIQDELRRASGGLPVAAVRSMNQLSSASTARRRFDTWLMSIFGGSALLLAVIGVASVMMYTVRARTREIGIRVAIGAESRSVRNMVLFQGMRLAVTGIAVGTASAAALAGLMEGFLFGVTPHDWVTFVSMPLLLGAVALAAVWLPARRAALVDPMVALRHD